MTELERISTTRPIPVMRGGQTIMGSDFGIAPGREGGYTLDDQGDRVRVTHPELKAALLIPWTTIAYAEEKRPEEPKAEVPAALGEVLARRGAEEPPAPVIVDAAARETKPDSAGIPAALRPPAGSETVPNYISADRAAAMSAEQLEALKADGVQILPAPMPVNGPKGDFPGKRK